MPHTPFAASPPTLMPAEIFTGHAFWRRCFLLLLVGVFFNGLPVHAQNAPAVLRKTNLPTTSRPSRSTPAVIPMRSTS